jgi:hypothetical protein
MCSVVVMRVFRDVRRVRMAVASLMAVSRAARRVARVIKGMIVAVEE